LRQIKALIPSIVIGVVGNSVIYMIPLLVGGMVGDRGFSEQQSGFLASADLGGYAVSTFVTALLLDRFRWRHMAFAGLALMILANIATCQAHDLVPFALARIASGLGCGVLAALASVVVGQTEQPDRNYGVLLAASLLYGTAALWGLPVLLDKFGLNVAYWLLVGLAAVVMFVVPSLPNERAQRDAAAAAGGSSRWILAAAVLLSILLFWAEQNDVYAYAERIGNAGGVPGGGEPDRLRRCLPGGGLGHAIGSARAHGALHRGDGDLLRRAHGSGRSVDLPGGDQHGGAVLEHHESVSARHPGGRRSHGPLAGARRHGHRCGSGVGACDRGACHWSRWIPGGPLAGLRLGCGDLAAVVSAIACPSDFLNDSATRQGWGRPAPAG
jgi:hypothetical protein